MDEEYCSKVLTAGSRNRLQVRIPAIGLANISSLERGTYHRSALALFMEEMNEIQNHDD